MEILKYDFTTPKTKKIVKTGIVIHGTASGSVASAINSFDSDVSVPYVIGRDGKIYSLYDPTFIHYHAGANYRNLSRNTIGIELECWNYAELKNGKYVSWCKTVIPTNEVTKLTPWRGKQYFHAITDEQHKSLEWLLSMLTNKYPIEKKLYRQYEPERILEPGWSGICFHSSFHPQKMDFHPDQINKIII